MSSLRFDGPTFEPSKDGRRLGRQLKLVLGIMSDGGWRTLNELQEAVQVRYGRRISEASLSTRLRDLRKPRFGGHSVERRRRDDARFEYWLASKSDPPALFDDIRARAGVKTLRAIRG